MCLLPGCAGQLRASCSPFLSLFMSFAMAKLFQAGMGLGMAYSSRVEAE